MKEDEVHKTEVTQQKLTSFEQTTTTIIIIVIIIITTLLGLDISTEASLTPLLPGTARGLRFHIASTSCGA